MNYVKVLRTLSIILVLTLLLAVIPVAPALAAGEEIDLNPEEGEIGDRITVTGEDFRESATGLWGAVVYFCLDDAEEGDEIDDEVQTYERVKTIQVDTDGALSGYFYIPDEMDDGDDDEAVTGGTYHVCVTYYDSTSAYYEPLIVAVAELTVAAGEITLDPDDGVVGTEVEVTGQGFGDEEEIVVEYDGDDIDIESGDDETDDDGDFDFTIIIPESDAGDHTITVIGEDSDTEAEADFSVEPEMTLTPETGAVGSQVIIYGTGYRGSRNVTITFDGGVVTTDPVSVRTNSWGSFSASMAVPDAAEGAHQIRVDDGTNTETANFIVQVLAAASISETAGYVGTGVAVSGTGFRANSQITVSFINEPVATAISDAAGDFSASFNIPAYPAGTHEVRISDGTSTTTASFQINANASLSEIVGYGGSEVTVSGNGFRASSPIAIIFDNEQVISTTTSTAGSFSAIFTVPERLTGIYKVRISDGTNTTSANYEIRTSASISETTGSVGSKLTISGNGFVVGGTVTVNYGEVKVATATVGSDGSFSATFTVPPSSAGANTIVATDGTNTQQFTFTMESEPPLQPNPLAPEMASKASAETSFDWDAVTDPSGVTYTLQVANNIAFSAESILLEKTGIVQSEYTITRDERLESTSKDTPYYWRVKAVDRASNESEWSGVGSFYVGFQFRLSQPVIYALFGVGALICGIIGFWIGRRTVDFY